MGHKYSLKIFELFSRLYSLMEIQTLLEWWNKKTKSFPGSSVLLPYAQKLTTNSRLKQHTFIISKFLWFKNSDTTLLGPQLRVLQVCSQGVEQADFLPGGWKNLEESASKLSQVVHKIYFLVWGKVLAFCTHQLKTTVWNQCGTTPSTLWGLQFADWRFWNFLASIIMWASQ